MKLKQTITLVAAASYICAAAPPVHAQVLYWDVGGRVREVIENHKRMVRAKEDFNATIRQARFAFFDAMQQPDKRAAAEKRFAEALFSKDLSYLLAKVPGGANSSLDLLHSKLGGEIDGGIPEPARPAFDAWVEAVRTKLGARRPDQLVLFDETTLLRAIDAGSDHYAAYRKHRDQFEFDRYDKPNTFGYARTGSPNHHLHKAAPGTLDLMLDMRYDRLSNNEALRNRLSALAKGGQRVLRCAYGPIQVLADGSARYEDLRFWLERPPAEINALIAADTTDGMVRMRTRSALAACPPTSDEAWAALGHPRAGSSGLTSTGNSGGTSAGSGGGTAPVASPAAPRTLEELNQLAEQQRRERQEQREASAARQREQYEAQRQRTEAQAQAQRDASAARQQLQRDAQQQRQCAAIDAQIERVRAQRQAVPTGHTTALEHRLQAMERNRAQRCG